PVGLGREEVERGARELAAEVLWPLFHDFAPEVPFTPAAWQGYERLNRKFAEAVARTAAPGDRLWVHDYPLILVAAELRRMEVALDCAFFLHVAFPSPDLFLR